MPDLHTATNNNKKRKPAISRVLFPGSLSGARVATIYLGFASQRTSNGLPGSPNEAGSLILPYLAFLQAGFALPPLSPAAR